MLVNPIDNEKVSKARAKQIKELRRARKGSRRMMRSGNPAKRTLAAKDNERIPKMIANVFIQDHNERSKG